ncbi:uncharacterized protein CDAR_442901 [Caerostris darwini]|uniref:Ig-like domain-containing protein n=1 Tax=Caerostris darwini TaxID=1538125 RepID=A0AAV4VQ07_9ARAC|nr:uncharacterized protein CDAR_442901 [Caerostris darwini]
MYTQLGVPSLLRARPAPESGAARNASAVRLVCHVECDPLCSVTWFRGQDSLLDSKFFVTETLVLEADPRRDVLRSVVSSLSWSLSHLPASSFDFSTFACRSSANPLGPPVHSSTLFRIEYPPENIQVSLSLLDVMEGDTPEDVVCSASAFPPGHYLWTVGETVLSRSRVLSFNTTVTRDMAGNYSCVVNNPHGRARADLQLRVNHRPECSVRKDYDDQRNVVLICRSVAHPAVANFTWFRDNASLSGLHGSGRHESALVLKGDDNPARYSCVSSNALGPSDPCKLQLTSLPGEISTYFTASLVHVSAACFDTNPSGAEKPILDPDDPVAGNWSMAKDNMPLHFSEGPRGLKTD